LKCKLDHLWRLQLFRRIMLFIDIRLLEIAENCKYTKFITELIHLNNYLDLVFGLSNSSFITRIAVTDITIFEHRNVSFNFNSPFERVPVNTFTYRHLKRNLTRGDIFQCISHSSNVSRMHWHWLNDIAFLTNDSLHFISIHHQDQRWCYSNPRWIFANNNKLY